VLLDKVYRNTREILSYINGLGYNVAIPTDLKNGSPVVEGECANCLEAGEYIKSLVENNPEQVVGVLYKTEDIDNVAALSVQESNTLKLMTFNESQGVEFEIVVLLKFGTVKKDFTAYPVELRQEKEKVDKDIQYVALTRSMNQLHILQISPIIKAVN